MMMQLGLQVTQNAYEVGAVLAKLTPVERTVTIGAAFALVLNDAVPLHLHQAHLQLLIHCVTAAMSGASQEDKIATARAMQVIVAAVAAIDAETLAAEAG